ncbi:MAG: amidase [Acidimicrobiaceae bacterium]|nr:amidase [Acidimicrobiaceae bacterium]MYE09447.1 amidase [Acidimicrobiaceae bacterium]MYH94510.1 amidase [Acidimicrobiaceae bacterium]
MTSTTDLCYLSATDAVELFRRRELSPRELMEAVIARAEEVEPTINAFTDTFFEEALATANAAADAYAKGTNRPLEGLPLAVKDEPHIEGQRITEGSLLFADQVATDTDPIAQRVIDAGAIVHARTATPEFSMAAVTWSHLHGVTRNPWNPDLTCGGSSGGSGASLAAGSSTLATGSDIAGSIRIPSSLNGLVGFKPPWGRVPEYWPWNRETYAASGPLARTVNDSALFENAISGPLDTDMFSLEPYQLPEPVPSGRGMRVAVSTDLGYFDVGREAAEALAHATAALAEAGIESEPVELDWTDEALSTAVTHLNFLSRSMLMSVLPDGAWDQLTPYIRDWFEDSPDVTVEQWWESWKYGDHMYLELRNKVFGAGFDALVCPTLTRNDIPADLGRGDDADPAALRDMLTFCMTYPFNILGRLPVMSVPVGLAASTGVPIGMQIVGPVEADLVPYRLAASLEAQQGPFFNTHRPTLHHPD